MAKDAQDRFQSVAEILQELDVGHVGHVGQGVGEAAIAAATASVAVARPQTQGAGRPVPPPLPHQRPSPRRSRRAERELRRHLEDVMPTIEAAGGRRSLEAQGNTPERPLAESFFDDFEEGEVGGPRAPAPRPRREGPPVLLRPFVWLGRLVGNVFHNFVRYAIVLLITAGLAVLIDLAIRGLFP